MINGSSESWKFGCDPLLWLRKFTSCSHSQLFCLQMRWLFLYPWWRFEVLPIWGIMWNERTQELWQLWLFLLIWEGRNWVLHSLPSWCLMMLGTGNTSKYLWTGGPSLPILWPFLIEWDNSHELRLFSSQVWIIKVLVRHKSHVWNLFLLESSWWNVNLLLKTRIG